jgi:hypothetical protein
VVFAIPSARWPRTLGSMGSEPIILILAVIFLPLLARLVYLALKKKTRIYGTTVLCAAVVFGTWGMVADRAVSFLGFAVYFTLAGLAASIVGLVVLGLMSLVSRIRRGRNHAA